MTQKNKELLLKDLCARLLYKTYLWTDRASEEPIIICSIYCDANDGHIDIMVDDGLTYDIEDVKPYLRPMSSMTEEEWEELRLLKNQLVECDEKNDEKFYGIIDEIHHLFYSRHIDCSNLISKGLALEAPNGMYKE